MEHDDRTPVATFFADAGFAAGERVELGENASHHARVKRLEAGDAVRLSDGAGRIALGSIRTIARNALSVDVDRVEDVVQAPAIHLRVPIADRDRMLWLAEKATELGIASWQAVRFRRSSSVSPRGEGPAFGEKIRARMLSALEQSGGAWLPLVQPDIPLADLVAAEQTNPLVLDAGGARFATVLTNAAGAPTVLVGPEGGIEPAELELLENAGWRRVRLASNTLRFETAGIAAVAALRANHLFAEG